MKSIRGIEEPEALLDNVLRSPGGVCLFIADPREIHLRLKARSFQVAHPLSHLFNALLIGRSIREQSLNVNKLLSCLRVPPEPF
jgi:hypothetical protein